MSATESLVFACADLDARPLFWTESDRQRFGYEPTVAEAVAALLNLELEWKFLRWADFAPALHAGEVDAIWCGSAITPQREQQFLYSRPYAIFNESALIRRGDPIRSSDDLSGRKVAAISGSTNLALARQWEACLPVAFDGTSDNVFDDMIEALRQKQVDAVIDDEPAFGGLLADAEFDIAFTITTENRWGAAMRPSSQDLKNRIDESLEKLIESGQIESIWAQHFPQIPYPRI